MRLSPHQRSFLTKIRTVFIGWGVIPSGDVGCGGSGGRGVAAGGFMDVQEIIRQIRILNQEGRLAAPINYADVIEVLSTLPCQKVSQILKKVAKRAAEISNPTNFIFVHAHRIKKKTKHL